MIHTIFKDYNSYLVTRIQHTQYPTIQAPPIFVIKPSTFGVNYSPIDLDESGVVGVVFPSLWDVILKLQCLNTRATYQYPSAKCKALEKPDYDLPGSGSGP